MVPLTVGNLNVMSDYFDGCDFRKLGKNRDLDVSQALNL